MSVINTLYNGLPITDEWEWEISLKLNNLNTIQYASRIAGDLFDNSSNNLNPTVVEYLQHLNNCAIFMTRETTPVGDPYNVGTTLSRVRGPRILGYGYSTIGEWRGGDSDSTLLIPFADWDIFKNIYPYFKYNGFKVLTEGENIIYGGSSSTPPSEGNHTIYVDIDFILHDVINDIYRCPYGNTAVVTRFFSEEEYLYTENFPIHKGIMCSHLNNGKRIWYHPEDIDKAWLVLSFRRCCGISLADEVDHNSLLYTYDPYTLHLKSVKIFANTFFDRYEWQAPYE